MKNNSLSNIAHAYLETQGYLVLHFFQENVSLSQEEVEYGWQLVHQLDPHKKHGVLLITAPYSLLNDDARKFVIKEIKSWPFVSIVVHNLGQKLMGNFALKLIGKSKNVRIFENKEDATIWLKDRIKISV